jgi:hypothetical protein
MSVPRKPLHIFRSPLTDHYYATRSYKMEGNGIVTVGENREDVTDEIEAIVKVRLRETANEK